MPRLVGGDESRPYNIFTFPGSPALCLPAVGWGGELHLKVVYVGSMVSDHLKGAWAPLIL
jgi:hypothetical protein